MIKKKIYVKLSKNYFFLIKDTNIPYSLHFRINCCKKVTTFFFFWQISAYPKGWFPHSCTFYVNQFIGWKVNIQFVDQLKGKRKKKKKKKNKSTHVCIEYGKKKFTNRVDTWTMISRPLYEVSVRATVSLFTHVVGHKLPLTLLSEYVETSMRALSYRQCC